MEYIWFLRGSLLMPTPDPFPSSFHVRRAPPKSTPSSKNLSAFKGRLLRPPSLFSGGGLFVFSSVAEHRGSGRTCRRASSTPHPQPESSVQLGGAPPPCRVTDAPRAHLSQFSRGWSEMGGAWAAWRPLTPSDSRRYAAGKTSWNNELRVKEKK